MKKNVSILLILCFLVAANSKSFAQCCAAGNPITADGSASGGGKKVLEVQALYKYSYSDTYYEGSNNSGYKYIDYSYFNFTSLHLSYGITKRLKVSVELGYFFSKAQTFVFGFARSAHGLGDGVIGLQYNAYKNLSREIDIFPYTRITLPIGQFDQMSGPVVLPIDIQPSSGSFKYALGCLISKRYLEGKVAFFVDGSAEFSQRIETDRTNYKYGNLYNASLYGSYKFWKKLTGALQLRGQLREKASDRNEELVNATGGYVMFLSPQIRYNFVKFWNIGFVFEYPFYKNMNGTQLTNKYALTFKLSRTINFNKSSAKKPDR